MGAASPSAGAPAPASSSYLKVLLFGCAILVISTGARSSFGLFLPEMTMARGWSRETFSFAIAIQNLMWGIGGSFLGAMADKYGSLRTLLLGGVLYVLGLLGMAWAETGLGLNLSAGLLIGVAIGGTSFGIILATLGKLVPPEKRSLAFGIGVASGSFGQFLFLPLAGWMIADLGWQTALVLHAAIVGAIVVLAFGVRGDTPAAGQGGEVRLADGMRDAFGDRSFHLLFWGYFVCGLQIVFLQLHLPAYLLDKGMPANVGAAAIALIGLFNVIGSLGAGMLGQRYPKKWLLSGIYVARSLVIGLFLLAPLTTWSVWLFSAAIGLLWLSTVPLTNALVGQVWGVKYLGLLGGIVFFGHQIGSFLGAWLGGRFFDQFGNYDLAWALVIGFGVFAALVHAPIDQRPLGERRIVSAA
ncbi:MFS transporter [Burkholderiaceae bacterium FT117]|uniref:MFS transporter n=1 Tax=Zeimonas sediminis TaxID=2944268 RepID=UPI002342DCBB|nr:MFS transporter [Zeimonas sediminis]MCM5572178.1 MFS transporter [Zeimonas sediminis]